MTKVFAYSLQWFKSQKGKKPVRILPLPSPRKSAESQITANQHQSSAGNFQDIKVAICGLANDTIVFLPSIFPLTSIFSIHK